MVSNDSFLSRLLPGLLVAAAIFAAWWLFIRAGDHPSVPQQAPGLLDAPSSVGPMLLQASQLGPTYDQSAEAPAPRPRSRSARASRPRPRR